MNDRQKEELRERFVVLTYTLSGLQEIRADLVTKGKAILNSDPLCVFAAQEITTVIADMKAIDKAMAVVQRHIEGVT